MNINKISKDFNKINSLQKEVFTITDNIKQIEFGLGNTSLDFYIMVGSRRIDINSKLFFTLLQILHHHFTERLSELNEELVKYNIGVEDEID